MRRSASGESREKQGGGDFPFFPGQDIEGPASGLGIHDLDSFACLHERLHQLRGRESKELAGPQQDNLGVECGEEIEIGAGQGAESRGGPFLDQLVWEDYQIVLMSDGIDADIVFAVRRKGVPSFCLGELQLHKLRCEVR